MRTLTLCLLSVIFLFTTCKKSDKTNPTTDEFNTTYIKTGATTPQQKSVLLEMISGVRVVNSPEALAVAKSITDMNPNRVNLVYLCPDLNGLTALTKPISDPPVVSVYDFRTKVSSDIISTVAIPSALPAGYINRKVFSANMDPIVYRAEWGYAVAEELKGTTPVNIEVSTSYNASSNELTADVTLTYTAAVNGEDYLSLAIVEDNIKDVQEVKDSNSNVIYVQYFNHRNVLRDMMTNVNGDLINTSNAITLVPGRVVKRRFVKKVLPFDDSQNLKVVAYVHRGETPKYYVVHSQSSL